MDKPTLDTISIKDYAKIRGVTIQAVQKQIARRLQGFDTLPGISRVIRKKNGFYVLYLRPGVTIPKGRVNKYQTL